MSIFVNIIVCNKLNVSVLFIYIIIEGLWRDKINSAGEAMNYDTILVELIIRVKKLEEELNNLKQSVYEDSTPVDRGGLEYDGKTFSRVQAREIAMEHLARLLPDYSVQKSTRQEGGGIKLVSRFDDVMAPVLIKFSYSKCHKKKNEEHSWFTLQLSELEENIDFCIFAMLDTNEEWHYFILSREEVVGFCKTHHAPDGDKIHLFFTIEDGQAYEIRYDKINTSWCWNNWSAFSEYQ